MAYQFNREPLTADEANRLASVCNIYEEKLIVWTLLDTGLRVAELANLTKDGSEQEFDKRPISRSFPEKHEFGLGDGHTLSLEEQIV